MKIPAKVKIKGRIYYQIVWSDLIRDDPECLGLTDGEQRTIYLKLGMSEQETVKTLIHELLHALEFEWETPIPHRITYTLEEAIYRLLRANRWI